MIQYRYISNDTSIKRIMDGVISVVPCDPGNVDWQEYQQWLAEDNTPLEADD